MNEILEIEFDARWGTACIGVDSYGDDELKEDFTSDHYMVTEGIFILDTQERDEEHIVQLTLRALDKCAFSTFVTPEGLREVTDPQNDILLIPGGDSARLL